MYHIDHMTSEKLLGTNKINNSSSSTFQMIVMHSMFASCKMMMTIETLNLD